MKLEPVDIADENDQVIGQTTKEEAHEKGLLHRTVIAEVVNSEGKFLLVKQAAHKQDFDQLVSPMGGHVRAGESEEEALQREALEELGLKDFPYKLIGKIIFNRPVRDHLENHYFIVYEIKSETEPILNDESVEFVRFSKEELHQELINNPNHFGVPFRFLASKLYNNFE